MADDMDRIVRDGLLRDRAREHGPAYLALFRSMELMYEYILELDLDEWTTYVMRSAHNPQQEGTCTSYAFGADKFCTYEIMDEDRPVAEALLSADALEEFYASGRSQVCAELRVCATGLVYEWVELCVSAVSPTPGNGRKLLILVRNINSSKLMKGIVDRFVYDSCDYFIYLDANKDSYVMFSGSDNGTPLPPATCDSYSTEIVKYAREFVVEEDQDYTIEQMRLPYVLERLDKFGEHSFYTGVIEDQRGYTRKHLRYLYYDRRNSMILLVRTDVTDVYLAEKRKNDRLRQALKEANTDFLTGLANRMYLESSIGRMLRQPEVRPGAFFFADVDNFKTINDTLGHARGDDVLRYVARSFKRMVPDSYVIGRFGGDEFVAFCPNVESLACVEAMAQSFCDVFDGCDDSAFDLLSCSVGVTLYPYDGVTFEDLLKRADQALYRSKNNGKSRYSLFDQASRTLLEADLRTAPKPC